MFDLVNELHNENKELKSNFEFEENGCKLCFRITIDELKYFIKDYEEDEIDITVHSLIRDVDLLLGNKQDIFSGYISFIIDCKEDLEKENEELKKQLKDCTKKAKEEIRKQREENAIRWANIGR